MRIEFRSLSDVAWKWVRDRQLITRCDDTTGVVAIDVDNADEIVAAIVLDSWTKNACFAHIIIEKPMVLRHGFLEEAFTFTFDRADRKIVLGTVRSDNLKAQKLDEHIGFVELARVKDGYEDGVDNIFYEIRRESSKWHASAAQDVAV